MNIEKFIDELNALLDELDEFSDNEDIEDLNANLEDILFMLSEPGEEDDFEEELEEAIDDLYDLADEYRDIPETAKYGDSISAIAARITMVMNNR